ncbi:MAG: hypothetical protein ACRD2Z_00885, partial [Thermoanaerobaculia bacterium]
MADTASTQLRLTCYVREEEGEWVAGCPSLDVHTQADSKEEAQAALEEAVDLWLDSCLERDTLHTALRELGWHRVPVGTEPHETCDSLEFSRPAVESVLGESFPIALTVPAFIAASIGFDDPHR